MNQIDQAVDALFRSISNSGKYLKSELTLALKIDDELFMEAVDRLCALSNLFQYERKSQILIVLASYLPLDEERIRAQLSEVEDKVILKRSFITDSTNSDLEKIKLSSSNQEESICAAVAITEMQQGGRGRRAKHWISPLAKNLYFSFKYHFPQSAFPYLSNLSLRSGITLLKVLNELGIQDARIKWPNDIWVKGQKLAGILVESTITSQGMDVIIGIGVNNQHDQFSDVIGNHPTSCEAILGVPLDRNVLVARLTKGLYQLCEQISEEPKKLPDLCQQWKNYSYFYGQTVRLISDKAQEIGQEIGIDESGALLIQYADGSIKAHLSSDLSLRAY